MKRLLLTLVMLPLDAPVFVALLVLRLCRQGVFDTGDCVFWFCVKPDSWLQRRMDWRGATTLGDLIVMNCPDDDGAVLVHELVHVEQQQAAALVGTPLAVVALLTGAWWLALPLAFLPWLVYGGASLLAVLNGGHWYRDQINERAARAIAGEDE